MINLLNPLIQGFDLARFGKSPIKVQLLYERLSYFCFTCDRLGHISPTCPVKPPPINVLLYSPSLTAQPLIFSEFQVISKISSKPLHVHANPKHDSPSVLMHSVQLIKPGFPSFPMLEGRGSSKNLSSLVPHSTKS
jgi:hypothetical protein